MVLAILFLVFFLVSLNIRWEFQAHVFCLIYCLGKLSDNLIPLVEFLKQESNIFPPRKGLLMPL